MVRDLKEMVLRRVVNWEIAAQKPKKKNCKSSEREWENTVNQQLEKGKGDA
jgi:hypothetical protein